MSKNGKLLLSNYIRHASTHNRIQEERMMWQQRELEQSREDICPGWGERYRKRAAPLARGHLVSDIDRRLSPEPSDSGAEGHTHSPNYWTRQLMKAEESDPYRWGHGGYKEQHPEEFVSSDEEQSDRVATTSCKKPKKRKRARSGSPSPAKKQKKSKKKEKKKHHSTSKRKKQHKKLRTKRTISSSESSISDDS